MNLNKEINNNNVDNSSNYKSRNKNTTQKYTGNKLAENQKFLTQEETKPIKKKPQEISKIVTAFTTIISASIIGISALDILPSGSTSKGQFIDIWTSTNEVSYTVELENYDETYDYYVVIYNDFTNRSEKMEDNVQEGTFEELAENMTYTLALMQGNKVIASKTVKTGGRQQYYGQDKPDDDPTQGNGYKTQKI